MADFSGRVAVVTGASRGIGYAVARELGKAGAHVVAVARTVGGLEDLDDAIQAEGGSATLVPLDLRDAAAIDRLGAALYERWGKLDILFGNAGILGAITPVSHLEPKVFDQAMALNVTANWRLIRSLDPLLRQSDAGRALFATAAEARAIRPFWGVTAATKAALEALVRTYAAELGPTRVTANLVDPGPVRTHLRAQAFPGEDATRLPAPADIALAIVRLLTPGFTENGALVTLSSAG